MENVKLKKERKSTKIYINSIIVNSTDSKRKHYKGILFGIYIQNKENKRRHRRKSASNKKKPKLPLLDRVASILVKGELLDYTEPKEVDVYFTYIYKTYEYLSYLEYFMSFYIFKKYFNELLNGGNMQTELTLKLITETYQEIKELKNILMTYMVNGLKLTIGRVFKSKFYGWRSYTDDIISYMSTIIIENISSLDFDPDKAKASVYFSNTLWFSTMGYTNKIKDYNQRYVFPKPQFEREDRGIKEFSFDDNSFEVIDIMTESYSHEDLFHIEYSLDEKIEDNPMESDTITEDIYDKDVNITEPNPLDTGEERHQELKEIVMHILDDLGLPYDILYTSSEKELQKIAQKIKAYIRKNKHKYEYIMEKVQELLNL